ICVLGAGIDRPGFGWRGLRQRLVARLAAAPFARLLAGLRLTACGRRLGGPGVFRLHGRRAAGLGRRAALALGLAGTLAATAAALRLAGLGLAACFPPWLAGGRFRASLR